MYGSAIDPIRLLGRPCPLAPSCLFPAFFSRKGARLSEYANRRDVFGPRFHDGEQPARLAGWVLQPHTAAQALGKGGLEGGQKVRKKVRETDERRWARSFLSSVQETVRETWRVAACAAAASTWGEASVAGERALQRCKGALGTRSGNKRPRHFFLSEINRVSGQKSPLFKGRFRHCRYVARNENAAVSFSGEISLAVFEAHFSIRARRAHA